MSFDKFLGKERRKSYRKAKSISKSCRNHGSCDYCLNNRLYTHKKEQKLLKKN